MVTLLDVIPRLQRVPPKHQQRAQRDVVPHAEPIVHLLQRTHLVRGQIVGQTRQRGRSHDGAAAQPVIFITRARPAVATRNLTQQLARQWRRPPPVLHAAPVDAALRPPRHAPLDPHVILEQHDPFRPRRRRRSFQPPNVFHDAAAAVHPRGGILPGEHAVIPLTRGGAVVARVGGDGHRRVGEVDPDGTNQLQRRLGLVGHLEIKPDAFSFVSFSRPRPFLRCLRRLRLRCRLRFLHAQRPLRRLLFEQMVVLAVDDHLWIGLRRLLRCSLLHHLFRD